MPPPPTPVPFVKSRPISPAEALIDALDRASTCNFICIARVRGGLTEGALTRALRALELRHPLLRARIARGWLRTKLVLDEAEPIPLRIEAGPEDAWRAIAESSIAHRTWRDAGPRAELTWLRHSRDHSTLLFCFQHIVSDGISGAIAMRDLLSFVVEHVERIEPLPSPGVSAFVPSQHGGWRKLLWALALSLRYFFQSKPRRLRAVKRAPLEQRRVRLDSIQLPVDVSARLFARAKRDRISVHGLVCAAIAQGTSLELGGLAQQRIMHPVDLRRHLLELGSDRPAIGEAVGCYATGVHTDHCVDPEAPLAEIAREITSSIRAKKAAGEPLLAASHLGPILTKSTAHLSRALFRELVESQIYVGTFSMSNLGNIDDFGVVARVGTLRIENVWSVSAGSVLHAMSAMALSFRGALNVQVCSVAPFVSPAVADRVLAAAERRLREYASVATCEPSTVALRAHHATL